MPITSGMTALARAKLSRTTMLRVEVIVAPTVQDPDGLASDPLHLGPVRRFAIAGITDDHAVLVEKVQVLPACHELSVWSSARISLALCTTSLSCSSVCAKAACLCQIQSTSLAPLYGSSSGTSAV